MITKKLPLAAVAVMLIAVSTNALAAEKSQDAYFVKVDRDTTTQNASSDERSKKMPRTSNAGDITLKRGVISSTPSAVTDVDEGNKASKGKGKVEYHWKVEEGTK